MTLAPAKTPVARPAQYVMVGFDGGLNLEQWQKIRDFSNSMRMTKKPLSLTYFVSGVYLLSDDNKHTYAPPKHSSGYSMIGFGEDNVQAISNRVDQMNNSIQEGQEIASHANGHFDAEADKWNLSDWSAELKQFNDLLFGAFFNNKAQPNPDNKYLHGYAFDAKEIVGFRAPYLGVTPDLFPALKAYGYTYDASTTGEATNWPRKDANGLWKFSVPVISVAGTGKKILSMDYNFYVAQSKAQEDLLNREAHRKQMVDSYLNYFNANYYGNRAPVYIGHHFALYNGGAYWDALQDFTKAVCGLPEVKCINYKQYATWVSSLNEETLAAYRAGDFEAMPRPKQLRYEPPRPLDVRLQILKRGEKIEIIASGSDYREELMKLILKINGKVIPLRSLTLPLLRHHFPVGTELEISATLLNKKGSEIQRATHVLKGLGTPQEQFIKIPLEERLLLGDLPEAHEWESSTGLSH
ncbi:polysaccharide deacetylase family protein [Bdellovibrio svalbardensis]|uniref:Polysaccharide deacetylase n=1 Tax=Bdellovibrio svalbardensis TaxID=2972972 RepID=A0ABT6DEE7_9BACT|nr:hypothetical protein [Bdellovibrio svalbardensis]MDG0815196.1 hypothetical protein [Bdellovibrio svalbardensis]